MIPKKVVIIGAGGHALVVADAIRAQGDTVWGFVDTVSPERKGQFFDGVKIVGGFDDLIGVAQEAGVDVAIGFGQCEARASIIREVGRHRMSLRTVIHPRATVSPSANLSEGVYVGPNVVIEASCRIGAGTIVNCGAIICHECAIGAAVAVCPGVMIGGGANVGDKTWLGIGAVVIDKIRIGPGCYVGAGSVVVKDLPRDVLAMGVPARSVKRLNGC